MRDIPRRIWRLVGIPRKLPRKCPRCGTALPFFRWPRSVHQAIAGGWTCRACGAGISKWGEVMSDRGPSD